MVWWIFFVLEWISLGVMGWRQYCRTQGARRCDLVTLRVVAEILQGLHSGHDLRSALGRLSGSSHAEVAQLGARWQQRCRSGLPLEEGSENQGGRSSLLHRVITHVMSFLHTGANPMPWLERTEQFLSQKQHYLRKLRTKTTQLRLQVYVLWVFSWASFVTTLGIFPGSLSVLLSHDLALRCLVLGLGIQILSIAILDRTLRKGVCVDL